MKLYDFKKGMRVRYVPGHVQSNFNDENTEGGVVKRVSDKYVFVIYDNAVMKMVTGNEPYTAAATDPDDLILENPPVTRYTRRLKV